MVCNKSGSLMVFTKELELARTIDVRNKGPQALEDILDISSDSHGNIYISSSNSPIHVFTNSGQFLRSFSGKFVQTPRGICIFGEYLYATNSNKVMVCTTKGERVTSFHSSAWGICTDKDGFIYVCHDNKRIAVM